MFARALIALPVVAVLIRAQSYATAERWCASHPLAFGRRGRRAQSPALSGRAVALAANACRPMPISCLPQALVLHKILVGDGWEPRIRFGARTAGTTMEAHAWVEVDGEPVNDSPDVAERYPMLSGAAEVTGPGSVAVVV